MFSFFISPRRNFWIGQPVFSCFFVFYNQILLSFHSFKCGILTAPVTDANLKSLRRLQWESTPNALSMYQTENDSAFFTELFLSSVVTTDWNAIPEERIGLNQIALTVSYLICIYAINLSLNPAQDLAAFDYEFITSLATFKTLKAKPAQLFWFRLLKIICNFCFYNNKLSE